MDKDQAQQLIDSEVQKLIDTVMPNGGGATLTEHRLRYVLEKISKISFETGHSYALLSLMTSDQVALEIGVSLRRMQAIAKNRHERFGVGFQVPGKNPWLFTPEEIDLLRPGKSGKRAKVKNDENSL
jgi:hypothetical protein